MWWVERAQRAARTQLCLACWPLEWSVALYLLPWCSVCVPSLY